MSTQETRRRFKLARNARNWGLSALLAATIGGAALYERSAVSASALPVLQLNQVTPTAQATQQAASLYQDGEYTGVSASAGRWGNTQVTAVIKNGLLTDFKITDYPHSTGRSLRISQVALPYLMQEAIQSQTASVNIVSGATMTSDAFMQSLQSALDQAQSAATPAATASVAASV